MGNRNVEVRAVGAWVQAEPCTRQPEGVVSQLFLSQRVRTCKKLF